MPDQPNRSPLQSAWLVFADSVQVLLVPELDDKPMYQYLQFRDNALALVRSQAFLDGLTEGWNAPPNSETGKTTTEQIDQVRNLMVLELQAFSNGLREDPAPPDIREKKKGWLRKWLGRAGSVADSMKDLPEKLKLPWYVESGLIAFKELVEAFAHN